MKFKKTMAGLATAGMVVLAGPAWAAGPYTVEVDGDTSGTQYPFEAVSTDSQFTVYAFGIIPVTMTCDSVTFSGTINTGANASGVGVATLTDSDWDTCSYGSAPIDVTPDHTTAWSLNATGTATSGTNDSVAGNVSGVDVNVDVSLPACNFDVGGFADGVTFHEGTNPQTLEVHEANGNLTISNPGCALFDQGDPAEFDATFDVTVYETDGVTVIPAPAVNIR